MANQYSGSFDFLVKEKFDCSAHSLLSQFASDGITYSEAEKKTGVSQSTIRKWAKRYGIELQPNDGSQNTQAQDIRALFQSPQLNIYNILSRKW